jgi:hypothetical protein
MKLFLLFIYAGFILQAESAVAPATIVLPDSAYPSIQDAVTAVRNRGVILLQPGLYNDEIEIPAGKTVTLSGPRVTPADPSAGAFLSHSGSRNELLLVDERASLILKNIYLINSSNAAIYGTSVAGPSGPKLTLVNVAFAPAVGSGIQGNWYSIAIKGSRISGQGFVGVAVNTEASLYVDHSDISNNGKNGLYASSIAGSRTTPKISYVVKNSTIIRNGDVGIFLAGANVVAQVVNTSVWNNMHNGIYSYRARVLLSDVDVGGTKLGSGSDGGDGVYFAGGEMWIRNSTISENYSAGVLSASCADLGGNHLPSKLTVSNSLIGDNASAVVEDRLFGCTSSVSIVNKLSKNNYCYPGGFNPALACYPINDSRTPAIY